MKKTYLTYGVVLCLIYAYVSLFGIELVDAIETGKWSPKGHSMYHK